jgi:predicted N-acetyltransferase YhbS
MTIRIDHLFQHPEHIPLVAGWIYREFWTDKRGYSVGTFEELLGQAAGRDRIPLSLLALVDGRPAGTVNLIVNDNSLRSELSPWLAALIVVPEFRGQGLGSRLVRELAGEARRLGYRELYLGTDIPGFYTRLGAVLHEHLTPQLEVMRLPLAAGPATEVA